MIPPVDPSSALRVTFLLRLTSDMLDAVPCYTLGGHSEKAQDAVISELAQCITILDQGWRTVLQSRIWDTTTESSTISVVASRAPSQTDRARLRSLLLSGQETLHEWLLTASHPLEEDGEQVILSPFWRSLAELGDAKAEYEDSDDIDIDDDMDEWESGSGDLEAMD